MTKLTLDEIRDEVLRTLNGSESWEEWMVILPRINRIRELYEDNWPAPSGFSIENRTRYPLNIIKKHETVQKTEHEDGTITYRTLNTVFVITEGENA